MQAAGFARPVALNLAQLGANYGCRCHANEKVVATACAIAAGSSRFNSTEHGGASKTAGPVEV